MNLSNYSIILLIIAVVDLIFTFFVMYKWILSKKNYEKLPTCLIGIAWCLGIVLFVALLFYVSVYSKF